MIISFKRITQNANSAVVIKDDSQCDIKNASARVTRTGTLDGGAFINHMGYADGDRRIIVRYHVDETDEDKLWTMFKNDLYVICSNRDGVFNGSISEMIIDRGQLDMIFLAKERIDEE